MSTDVVATVRELVRIPSVNPMGRALSGPEYYEYAVTDYLEAFFKELGVPFQRQTVAPLRDNIMARLDGSSGGPIILFEAHQDTVPVEGMTIDPFDARLDQGRVYGRGACDIKGGMASMLTAFGRLARERPKGMPTVVMACSVNEEHGFSGASNMAQWWASGDCALLTRVPDLAIVAEPTSLAIVVAHKGVVRWRCHTGGRASHSSLPHKGDNAIYRMAAVLDALRKYSAEAVPSLGHHPLLGTPTLSVGVISGGISVNTVPDHCAIEIDRRILPHENPVEAQQHAISYVRNQLANDPLVRHDEPFLCSPGLSDTLNRPLASQLREAIRACGHAGDIIGVPYGTDAPAFAKVQVPTVVFGPGSIEQAHTRDEWVEVTQLEAAAEILYRFVGLQATSRRTLEATG